MSTDPSSTTTAAEPRIDPAPEPTVSFRPLVLPAPERGDDLQLRVTAPTQGDRLPVIVFSHGFGFSMDGYGPIVDYWAARGFVVVQPTHLDSFSLGLSPEDPRTPTIWRYRIEDLGRAIDGLDRIEAGAPGLAGRINHDRVVIAGHSYGATTASALAGARIIDEAGEVGEDFSDSRVKAAILLAVAGTGGEDLTPFAAQNFPFMNPSFEAMRTPALVVGGDADQSLLSVRGPDWWNDAYLQSPGDKSLLTLFGAEHSLGGIPAYGGMPETAAERPELLALVQQATTAYLAQTVGDDEGAWAALRDGLATATDAAGRIESR